MKMNGFSPRQLLNKKLGDLRKYVLIVLIVTSFGLMSSQALPASAPNLPLSGMTVTLDPGHGGYDGGARAHDSGVWEKKLTLEIALATEEALKAQGARVYLTRRDDVSLHTSGSGKQRKRADLQKRIDIAEKLGSDALISIHLNEYRSRAESGPQVFYQQGGKEGEALAKALQAALIAHLRPKKERAAMAGDYYVLRGKLPSALVECGFLSHPGDEKLLLDKAYHKRIGEAIANGLIAWHGR